MLSVQAKGKIFNISSLVELIALGAVLFLVPPLLTDLIMLRCLKQRQKYKEAKFAETEDFSEFDEIMKKQQEEEERLNRRSGMQEERKQLNDSDSDYYDEE